MTGTACAGEVVVEGVDTFWSREEESIVANEGNSNLWQESTCWAAWGYIVVGWESDEVQNGSSRIEAASEGHCHTHVDLVDSLTEGTTVDWQVGLLHEMP